MVATEVQNLANLEELEIKLTVYQILAGLSDQTADSLPDETECQFGQWYYSGGGNKHYAGRADFRAIEEPHRFWADVFAVGKEPDTHAIHGLR